MRVTMDEVPMDVRRRAVRALEAALTSTLSRQELGKARLGDEVSPVYRPDLKEVAYWEFEVVGITTVLPISTDEAKEFDRGFIVVATGAHDVPIPHFSLELAPPSRQLEAGFGDATRIVKLDSLCYVAEDEKGTMLGRIGTMPPKLPTLPRAPKSAAGWATSLTTSGRDEVVEDGDKASTARLSRSRTSRPIKEYGPWDSWDDCTRGYSDAYAPHLTALAQRATYPWAIEALTDKYGQGIREGDTLSVPLLERGDFTIEGPGAEFVSAELNPQPLPPRLSLTPRDSRGARDLTFRVTFHYGRATESLTFFIVPSGAPTEIAPTVSPLGPVFGGR